MKKFLALVCLIFSTHGRAEFTVGGQHVDTRGKAPPPPLTAEQKAIMERSMYNFNVNMAIQQAKQKLVLGQDGASKAQVEKELKRLKALEEKFQAVLMKGGELTKEEKDFAEELLKKMPESNVEEWTADGGLRDSTSPYTGGFNEWMPNEYMKWGVDFEECSGKREKPDQKKLDELKSKFVKNLEKKIKEKGPNDISVAKIIYHYAGIFAVTGIDFISEFKKIKKKYPALDLAKPFLENKKPKSFLCMFPEKLQNDLNNILEFDVFPDPEIVQEDTECKIQNYGKTSAEYLDMIRKLIKEYKLPTNINCEDRLFSDLFKDILEDNRKYLSAYQYGHFQSFIRELPGPPCTPAINPFRGDVIHKESLSRLDIWKCGECEKIDQSFDAIHSKIVERKSRNSSYLASSHKFSGLTGNGKCYYRAEFKSNMRVIDVSVAPGSTPGGGEQ